MNKTEMAIIGAGIMGSSIFRYLQETVDIQMTIIDDNRKESGTSCCGGAIKPSKLTGLSNDDNRTVLEVLEACFGMEPVRFNIKPSGGIIKVDTYLLNMENVDAVRSCENFYEGTVSQIIPENNGNRIVFADGSELLAERTIISNGAWVSEILPEYKEKIYSKKGITYIFPISEELPEQSFVKTWAPYKQVTVHPLKRYGGTFLWTGDGTAVKQENWTSNHSREALKRVRGALDVSVQPYNVILGLRPFSKGKEKPCLIEEIMDNTWVVTGAGKFGAISAGWAGNHFKQLLVG